MKKLLAPRIATNRQAPIRKWRKANGLTQEQAATKLGFHRIHYIQVEGWYAPVGDKVARRIAAVTGQTVEQVISEYKQKAVRRRS